MQFSYMDDQSEDLTNLNQKKLKNIPVKMSICADKNRLLKKGCDATSDGNYQLIAIPEEVGEISPLCIVMSEKYLSELKEIIDKNSEDNLTKTCKSEIDAAFKNVHCQEGTGCNDMDNSHLALKIDTLVKTIVKCIHYFPDDEKEKIQEIFIKMNIHEDGFQKLFKPVSSKNTTKPETQTVNVSSKLVVVKSHREQDLHISATDCTIFINSNDIKVNMLDSEPFDNDVNKLFIKKRGIVRRKSIGSIKLLVRFQSKEALEKFQDEYKKGITEKEIYEILLKHKLIEQGSRIDVTINTAWLSISLEEFERIDKEVIDLVPFMVAAYNCENMEQLDSNLASTLEKRITSLQSRLHLTQHTGDSGSSSNCLFPTLLHFAASYGLTKSYKILLQKPESKEALKKMNKHGKTPVEVFENEERLEKPAKFLKMDVVTDVHRSFEKVEEERRHRKKPKRVSAFSVTLEGQGRVSTIEKQGMRPSDVVMSEDGCLLVSDWSNEIHKYKQSGEHVSSVTLPSTVKVRTLYKMKNNDLIVFTDFGNRCITLCKLDGDVIKSIGKGILSNPFGIYVDETLNVVYVADFDKHCVFKFNIDDDQLIKKIGSEGHNEGELNRPWDVTATSEGHLIVADCWNHRLQLFDIEGRFMKVLVGQGDQDGSVIYPQAVIIDKDNNMLVTSRNKLQVFNSDGQFIKRIDEDKDGLDCPYGLSIVSYNPRRVVVANRGGRNIKVFNELKSSTGSSTLSKSC